MPDLYRSIYDKNEKNIGRKYAIDATSNVKNIAAFISEPILGCGGQVPLPKNYLKILYKKVRENKVTQRITFIYYYHWFRQDCSF